MEISIRAPQPSRMLSWLRLELLGYHSSYLAFVVVFGGFVLSRQRPNKRKPAHCRDANWTEHETEKKTLKTRSTSLIRGVCTEATANEKVNPYANQRHLKSGELVHLIRFSRRNGLE
jgi:hypothetical protein